MTGHRARSEPHGIVTYEVTGTKRTNRWALGHLVETYHESPRFRTVAQAERSARTLCRLYGGTWDIDERVPNRSHSVPLAHVKTDALGRMWTDVMTGPTVATLL